MMRGLSPSDIRSSKYIRRVAAAKNTPWNAIEAAAAKNRQRNAIKAAARILDPKYQALVSNRSLKNALSSYPGTRAFSSATSGGERSTWRHARRQKAATRIQSITRGLKARVKNLGPYSGDIRLLQFVLEPQHKRHANLAEQRRIYLEKHGGPVYYYVDPHAKRVVGPRNFGAPIRYDLIQGAPFGRPEGNEQPRRVLEPAAKRIQAAARGIPARRQRQARRNNFAKAASTPAQTASPRNNDL